MADGPGKYDELTTYVREKTEAEAVVVVILGGSRGAGFDVQLATTPERRPLLLTTLIDIFRQVAAQMEADRDEILHSAGKKTA